MNFLGAGILAVLISVVLFGSRRSASLGMIAGVLYLTQAQQVDLCGFNVYAMRFLEAAGFLRVLVRSELLFRSSNGIDSTLLWLYGYSTVIFLFRSKEGQTNQIGIAVDAFLCYFTFRALIRDMDDFQSFLRAFVLLLAPFVLLVIIESVTARNPFTIMGGITGGDYWTRHGFPRCFGSFRQPDTLGMLGASFLPLYISLVFVAEERRRAIAGICLCLILAVASNSGGPASATLAAFLCWGLWCVRVHMRKVRWSLVGMLVGLGLVMKDPVWYILARASSLTGGGGWHRSYLIDLAYRHLNLWWFAGLSLSETKAWFPYVLPKVGTADITNEFLAFGFTAGLGALALFIWLLTRAYSILGKALAASRFNSSQANNDELLLWGMGGALTIHIVDWFGVTYFDQMYVVWFMQLAAIATVSQAYLERRTAAVTAERIALEISESKVNVGSD
jgi:hypothetical protein